MVQKRKGGFLPVLPTTDFSCFDNDNAMVPGGSANNVSSSGVSASASSSGHENKPEEVKGISTAARKDAPRIQTSVRADRKSAEAAATDYASKTKALGELERDVTAASSTGSRDSLWKTWTCFHHRWFGRSEPPLPLTPEKIKAVASMMKAGKYRSYANYMSRAKDEHIGN